VNRHFIIEGDDSQESSLQFRYLCPEAMAIVLLCLRTNRFLHNTNAPFLLQIWTFSEHLIFKIISESILRHRPRIPQLRHIVSTGWLTILALSRERRESHLQLATNHDAPLHRLQRLDRRFGGSGEDEATTFGFRNWISEFLRGLDPKTDSFLCVRQGRLLRGTVCGTPGKLRHFGHKSLVLVAPIDNDFVLVHLDNDFVLVHWVSLNCISEGLARTCFTW